MGEQYKTMFHLFNFSITSYSDGRTVGLPPLVTLTPNLVMLLLPVSRNYIQYLQDDTETKQRHDICQASVVITSFKHI